MYTMSFIVAKLWKKWQCPYIGEWLNEYRYIILGKRSSKISMN